MAVIKSDQIPRPESVNNLDDPLHTGLHNLAADIVDSLRDTLGENVQGSFSSVVGRLNDLNTRIGTAASAARLTSRLTILDAPSQSVYPPEGIRWTLARANDLNWWPGNADEFEARKVIPTEPGWYEFVFRTEFAPRTNFPTLETIRGQFGLRRNGAAVDSQNVKFRAHVQGDSLHATWHAYANGADDYFEVWPDLPNAQAASFTIADADLTVRWLGGSSANIAPSGGPTAMGALRYIEDDDNPGTYVLAASSPPDDGVTWRLYTGQLDPSTLPGHVAREGDFWWETTS